MRRIVNIRPQPGTSLLLAALPFVLLARGLSDRLAARLAANPNDKLLPGLLELSSAALHDMALIPTSAPATTCSGSDTAASLVRLGTGVALAAFIGLVLGIAIGLVPAAGATLSAFVAVISMIPPLAVLPILFIVFGLGELSKVVADRDRHRTLPRPRHRVSGRRAADGAAGQGADAGRLDLADRAAGRPAADPAPADRGPCASRSGRPGCS